jgi:dihydropteroate synthase
MFWSTTRFQIDLTEPKVMGIVNVTPDSFSDGGHFETARAALAHCETLLAEGAHILDIGGESSRPGAPNLSALEEWQRIESVVAGAVKLGAPISIDTCKAEVMRRALDLGADIINDIRALTGPGSEDVVVQHGRCGICLMHMRGDPATMQQAITYENVVDEVAAYLAQRSQALLNRGVHKERLMLDPGIGFGKTPEHNIELLRCQRALLTLSLPWLVGWSRKSTLGVITGKPVQERLIPSVAAALASITLGASVVRVHDVAATVDALKVWQAAGLPST